MLKIAMLAPALMVLAGAASTAVAQTPSGGTLALMPVPASVTVADGRLAVDGRFSVALAGATDPRLVSAIGRTMRRLERRTGLEFARGLAEAAAQATLVVDVARPSGPIPALGDDESYSLEVASGRAVLKAPATTGALRGLETLLQLVAGDRSGYYLPAVTVRDSPRFPWRGLLIDVCRHWMPIEVIKRNLDGMAAVKLNVLHLHLTEDQGFRVESRKFPRLHGMGSDGLYFTQAQIREIVAYAADRGIRVVPEFDMPGHVTSWLVGHPELGSAPGPYEIGRRWGVYDPAFDPTRESLYKFLDTFLGEMAGLFPDAFMHIGGDENNGKHWMANASIQAFMKKNGLADAHALQAYFNRRLAAILEKHGKRMVGWDEILHPDLPTDIVVQSWRGQASLADGARKGYAGILSNGYYIDLMQPTAQHYLVDPLPAGTDLTPEQAARILGGEACMWAEWISPETIDSRVWPRTAAIAERFWSPRSVRDVPDMFRRLAMVSVQFEDLGLTHESNAGMMLRRLTGTADTAALRTFVDMVEPVQGYQRGRFQRATQFTPLTRVVDVARPDSLAALRWRANVDDFLADAPRFGVARAEVAARLTALRDLRLALERQIDDAPVLQEISPLVVQVSNLAVVGLEALSFLQNREAPPDGWRARALEALAEAAAPRAALQLADVPTWRALVLAAAELPALRGMTPAEWKRRLDSLAAPPPRR